MKLVESLNGFVEIVDDELLFYNKYENGEADLESMGVLSEINETQMQEICISFSISSAYVTEEIGIKIG